MWTKRQIISFLESDNHRVTFDGFGVYQHNKSYFYAQANVAVFKKYWDKIDFSKFRVFQELEQPPEPIKVNISSKSYRDGFITGKNWKYNYIPGGPWTYNMGPDFSKEIQRRALESVENHKNWEAGFKDGYLENPNSARIKLFN